MPNLTEDQLIARREQAEIAGLWDLAERYEQALELLDDDADSADDNTQGAPEMTATAYLPRHASTWLPDATQDTAFELLGQVNDRLNGSPAQACAWRFAAFDLFAQVTIAKPGRHCAPESAPQVALVDDLLAVRGEHLASRTGAALPESWDTRAIKLLGRMARWS